MAYYQSRRANVFGIKGAVSSDQPEATRIGKDVLEAGGTAADGAVAMGAALNVLQPHTCGIGGDLWMLYFDNLEKKVYCIDGSGKTAAGFTSEKMKQLGFHNFPPPPAHPVCVSVPGAVAAWCDIYDRFGSGKCSLLELFRPAINLARNGFVISETTAFVWRGSYLEISVDQQLPFPIEFLDPETKRPPKPGKIMYLPDLARTYEEIGASGKNVFYDGQIAREIVDCLGSRGGILSLDDLSSHKTRFCDPISIGYTSKKLGNNFRIWETPLNTQAIVALESLKILEAYGIEKFTKSTKTEYFHAVLEALKLSFRDLSDVWKNATDGFPQNYDFLLAEATARGRASLIDANKATDLARKIDKLSTGDRGDTTYFSIVDKYGNACSAVYSNYMGFGTPWVPKGCGFTLHNRGYMTWEFAHRNFAPRVRPFHSLCAGLITTDNLESPELLSVFGVMGGHYQPQGHLQLLLDLLELGLSPQEALDRSRIMTHVDFDSFQNTVRIENCPEAPEIRSALQAKGHTVQAIVRGYDRNLFGKGHIITKGTFWDKEGRNSRDPVWWAGCDPRSDGIALGVL